VSVEIILEMHATSLDNEAGIASGWSDVTLSPKGREQAGEMAKRLLAEGVDAVYCSDLRRAAETAEIAFGAAVPVYLDPRLREYDYGTLTGAPAQQVHSQRATRVDTPFPEGESLRDVVERVRSLLDDLARGWDGRRVVLIGHSATRLALDHLLGGIALEEVANAPWKWVPVPSWRYVLEAGAAR